MNEQQLLDYLSRHEKATELTQRGIEEFNKGNFETALSLFEKSHEIKPNAIPNLLYDSLCRFSMLQCKIEKMSHTILIALPENQTDVEDIISKLESALAGLKLLKF